jgi:chromosome segregation ATPase
MWAWVIGRKRIQKLERQVNTLKRELDVRTANMRAEIASRDTRAVEIETCFDRKLEEVSEKVGRQEFDFVTKNDLRTAVACELNDYRDRLAFLTNATSQHDAKFVDIERAVSRIEAKLGLLQVENDKLLNALLERLGTHVRR